LIETKAQRTGTEAQRKAQRDGGTDVRRVDGVLPYRLMLNDMEVWGLVKSCGKIRACLEP